MAERIASGVRLLRQCKSPGGSSTLEPGHRISSGWHFSRQHRQEADVDVQWLRRIRRPNVFRNGSSKEFLDTAYADCPSFTLLICYFYNIRCMVDSMEAVSTEAT